jgi:exopolysaccharide production repressor protein
MSFLLFLRGAIGVLLVFAITTYVVTQSLWTTFIQTMICAVLLQIGYFAAVLFLVWRSAGRGRLKKARQRMKLCKARRPKTSRQARSAGCRASRARIIREPRRDSSVVIRNLQIRRQQPMTVARVIA